MRFPKRSSFVRKVDWTKTLTKVSPGLVNANKPPTAFVLFKSENPGKQDLEQVWNALDAERKQPYLDRTKALRENYADLCKQICQIAIRLIIFKFQKMMQNDRFQRV